MGNLQFEPKAFIDNLSVMGIGMLGVFLIIGIIIAATYAIGKLTTKKQDNDQ
jgi:Na+-transporting methylmalonyl-CoA/oxaloacetate decarboxylase gamma subunit